MAAEEYRYNYEPFPKWLYHKKTGESRLVNSPGEMDALGPDWAETPPVKK